MCGELDEDTELGAELFDRLQILARPYLRDATNTDRPKAFEEASADEAMHLYMDRLFAALLKACVDDAGSVPAPNKADVVVAQSIVLARLAGLIAGQLPPQAETLRNGIEALMDGYNERDRPRGDHHH